MSCKECNNIVNIISLSDAAVGAICQCRSCGNCFIVVKGKKLNYLRKLKTPVSIAKEV